MKSIVRYAWTFGIVNVIDCFGTAYLVSTGVWREHNPLFRWILLTLGIPAFIVVKLLFSAATIYLLVANKNKLVLYWLTITMSIVAGWIACNVFFAMVLL